MALEISWLKVQRRSQTHQQWTDISHCYRIKTRNIIREKVGGGDLKKTKNKTHFHVACRVERHCCHGNSLCGHQQCVKNGVERQRRDCQWTVALPGGLVRQLRPSSAVLRMSATFSHQTHFEAVH